MKTVTRKEITFHVANGAQDSWNFWEIWADEQWEKSLFDQLDRFLPVNTLLIDVGAWIGPITLWAARRGALVIAIEPDPIALDQLHANVNANYLSQRVTIIPAAATMEDHGQAMLWSVRDWGASTSSLTAQQGIPLEVPTVDILALCERERPDLVKIDVEGGEALFFPALGPILRELRVPVLLSIHPIQMSAEAWELVHAEIENWNVTYLNEHHESLLLEAK